MVMEKLREIANTILNMLQFTQDHPGAHRSGWMPCLDLQVRVKEDQIQFKYFEKQCSNNYVIMERSAMSLSSKRTSLVQEGLRRMVNTSSALPDEIWRSVMEDFLVKLMRSGYSSRFREQVVHGALSAYQCRLRQMREGLRPLYRPRDYERDKRELDKIKKKENWYKGGGEMEPITVMFVTATPGGELAKTINSRLKEARVPVRIAEKAGMKLSRLVMKTNPHQLDCCDRSDCLPCANTSLKGSSKCGKEGVVYSMVCRSCSNVYIGETASTSYIRGKEHVYQYKLWRERKVGGQNSVMGRHSEKCHEGEYVEFNMSVLSHHLADTHVRQISESANIDEVDPDKLINTRRERGVGLLSQASGALIRN